MLSITRQNRINQIRDLIDQLEEKKSLYFNKSQRAKSDAKHAYWWFKYETLRDIITRYYADRTRFYYQFGKGDVLRDWKKADYKKAEAERIETGKYKFLNTHYYSLWFYSNSLDADYHTYNCDRCKRTFYHSPSTITKANQKVFECCCGYCTNEIIGQDHNSKPYS